MEPEDLEIWKKSKNYLAVSKILTGDLCSELAEAIGDFVKIFDEFDTGTKDLPKAHAVWVATWTDLYNHVQEHGSEGLPGGITKESLLADKEKIVKVTYPAILNTCTKLVELIKKSELLIERLKLENTDGR